MKREKKKKEIGLEENWRKFGEFYSESIYTKRKEMVQDEVSRTEEGDG